MSEIKHYGVARKSGRYPWGSGDDPEQRNASLIGRANELRKKGMKEKEIAKGLGMSINDVRNKRSLEKAADRAAKSAEAQKLKDKGYSNVAGGKIMGINESSFRALLNTATQQRSEITNVTANMLRDAVDKKKYIDVGIGVERYLGVSRTKLKTAISQLQEEGYKVYYVKVLQLGTGKNTSLITLCKPDVEYKELYQNRDQIQLVTDRHSSDGGRSFEGLKPIQNVSSSRIKIRYADEGGSSKDGVIELRRGVDDISLGNVKYAQVRVGVDGTHFLKGMAIYENDMPPGIDIIYNTNKPSGTQKEKVFKEMKKNQNGEIDTDNPFGATIKAGGQRGALNVVNEEGDWEKWSKNISSQMLSKQSWALAKKQLGLTYNSKKEELDEILSLTNPVVRRKLLESFADDSDSSAVHLKSAALPRQGSHVILPIPKMKDNEIYAPNYRNGERVVLVRYPHGGIFEIPELVVNNKQSDAIKIMKQAKDAVGISPKVASRLSGADFDGDTVLVIPNDKGLIKHSSPLEGLKDFDPQSSYPYYEGMTPINPRNKQKKMGDVSNLITDMTIKGAISSELARAVRHSMVVIDSEKHKLNYKQSYIDNGIAALKAKYQGSEKGGASTLISKASSDVRVGIRKESVDPTTGKRVYEYTDETYTNNKGKSVIKTVSSSKMFETPDAFTLSSGTPMETVYAEHANKLKGLANDARKTAINTRPIPYSASAKKAYEPEVSSLLAQLNLALKNKPLERQAQLLANSIVATKKANNLDMEADDLKKLKGRALNEARIRTGAKKQEIEISPKEWEAIQSGAISTNTLMQILNNTNMDKVKVLATPRTPIALTANKISKAKSMMEAGRTQSEIADALGVSISTVAKMF